MHTLTLFFYSFLILRWKEVESGGTRIFTPACKNKRYGDSTNYIHVCSTKRLIIHFIITSMNLTAESC